MFCVRFEDVSPRVVCPTDTDYTKIETAYRTHSYDPRFRMLALEFSMSIKDHRRLEAAEGYLMLGMPDHALKSLGEIEHTREFQCEIDKNSGEAYRQKEDYAQALKAYEQIDLKDCPDLEIMIGIAWCYKRTNRLHLSISTMETAYKSFPEEPIVLYNIACYYALAQAKEQALSWLGRAIRMQGSLRKLVALESDFDSLRNDPDFQFVTTEFQK